MQCLVIILAMLPTTGVLEIIWPLKEGNRLAETLKSALIICSMAFKIFVTLLSAIFKVPKTEFHVMPNQFETWVGSHTDFSSLTINPALVKWFLTVSAVMRPACLSWTVPQPSWRKIAIETPFSLQCFLRVLRALWTRNGPRINQTEGLQRHKILHSQN